MDRNRQLHRRDFLRLTAGSAAALSGLHYSQAAEKPLNIVLILVDDLGWTDVGCYGSDFYETPNIDRLASEGMRFTQAYSACTVCSPTRAAILTGKYPARLHLTDWIPGHPKPDAKLKVPGFHQELPLEETTLAEILKEHGYATASVGKWHLGKQPFYPEKQGFDVNIAGTDKGQPPSYFSPYKIHTLKDGPEGEYITDRITDEALRWIEQNRERPFFLYWPHFAVHTPIQSKEDLIQKYRQKAPGQSHSNAKYAAMMESLDQSIGRLMAKLEEWGLTDHTVVIFTSDNGGLLKQTDNTPLRQGKGTAYEGGVRIPLIVKWPGVTNPGRVSDIQCISMDLFATLCAATGTQPKDEMDGMSLVPILRGQARLPERPLFWHYPHYHTEGATPYSAVRLGDYRLIEFLEDGHLELYNLKEDIGEIRDLAKEWPKKARELAAMVHDWRDEVKAQMPEVVQK